MSALAPSICITRFKLYARTCKLISVLTCFNVFIWKCVDLFGTDVVVNPEACADQNREFVERTKWFTPAEVLTQATSLSGELPQLSGPRSPYPGVIGKIEEGAHADVLLIDGNPLEDISILRNHEEVLDLIMKGGVIFKSELE